MKVFLTGASGYIGGSIATKLLAAGHHIMGLVRSGESAAKLRKIGIEPLVDFGVNTATVKPSVPSLYKSTGMASPLSG